MHSKNYSMGSQFIHRITSHHPDNQLIDYHKWSPNQNYRYTFCIPVSFCWCAEILHFTNHWSDNYSMCKLRSTGQVALVHHFDWWLCFSNQDYYQLGDWMSQWLNSILPVKWKKILDHRTVGLRIFSEKITRRNEEKIKTESMSYISCFKSQKVWKYSTITIIPELMVTTEYF